MSLLPLKRQYCEVEEEGKLLAHFSLSFSLASSFSFSTSTETTATFISLPFPFPSHSLPRPSTSDGRPRPRPADLRGQGPGLDGQGDGSESKRRRGGAQSRRRKGVSCCWTGLFFFRLAPFFFPAHQRASRAPSRIETRQQIEEESRAAVAFLSISCSLSTLPFPLFHNLFPTNKKLKTTESPWAATGAPSPSSATTASPSGSAPAKRTLP